MWLVSRISILAALATVSLNLASGWLGVVLISPGVVGVESSKYIELRSSQI